MKKNILLTIVITFITLSSSMLAMQKTDVLELSLGLSDYQVILFDIRPYIMELFEEKGVCTRDRKPFSSLNFSYRDGSNLQLFNLGMLHGKEFRIGSVTTNQVATKVPRKQLSGKQIVAINLFNQSAYEYNPEYSPEETEIEDDCMSDTNDNLTINFSKRILSLFTYTKYVNNKQNRELYIKEIPERKSENIYHRLSHVSAFSVPSMSQKSYRANLFDMFSQEVDKQLLNYGIAETINKEYENKISHQLQISFFGIIKGNAENGTFWYPGFFQYTFDLNGTCYHRAFKPWTASHLAGISCSYTQAILRVAMLNFLNTQIDRGVKKEGDEEFITHFKTMRTELLAVCKHCRDHCNWFFSYRIASHKLLELLHQVKHETFIS